MSANQTAITPVYLSRGARGYLVANLQRSLGIPADGIFGMATEAALRRSPHQNAENGLAGPQLHQALGLPWPSQFERCINLVSVLEGTGFGDCNLRDIDGAGVTFGIAGFTTAHGEVQTLLRQFARASPAHVDQAGPLISSELRTLLRGGDGKSSWDRAVYGPDGRVRRQWLTAFRTWGDTEIMQRLQLALVRRTMWEPALRQAECLGFRSPRSHCFFLDVAVQNGGWRAAHLQAAQAHSAWAAGSESERMAVVAQAVAACAALRWRSDVLIRKQTIAHGHGTVHGLSIQLEAYGIPGPEPDG